MHRPKCPGSIVGALGARSELDGELQLSHGGVELRLHADRRFVRIDLENGSGKDLRKLFHEALRGRRRFRRSLSDLRRSGWVFSLCSGQKQIIVFSSSPFPKVSPLNLLMLYLFGVNKTASLAN